MTATTPKQRFLDSLERCSVKEHFIESFYDHFLGQSEEIREKFKDTDFDEQNVMLLRSLRLAAGATAGQPEALREMRERAESHDRHHLNIEPRLYDTWLESVVETAQEFDPKWNGDVEEAWRAELGYVINHMKRYY